MTVMGTLPGWLPDNSSQKIDTHGSTRIAWERKLEARIAGNATGVLKKPGYSRSRQRMLNWGLPGNVFPRPAEQTRQTAQARGHSPGPLPVRRLTGTGEACLSFRFAVVEPCAKIANRGSLLLDQPLALGQQGAQPFDPCR